MSQACTAFRAIDEARSSYCASNQPATIDFLRRLIGTSRSLLKRQYHCWPSIHDLAIRLNAQPSASDMDAHALLTQRHRGAPRAIRRIHAAPELGVNMQIMQIG